MIARGNARKILDNYCITAPDKLDLTALAGYQNIIIESADLKNHIARIHHTADYGLIKISDRIPDEGQRRFVIAHELGHFINERKKNIRGCTSADLIEYKSRKELERDANIFAAELLMREEWLREFTKGKYPGIKLIKDCAEHFRTSLTSAAIRYAEAGSHPTAVILSKDKKVKWSVINKDFRFQWVPTGYPVNGNSYVYEYFNHGNMDNEANEVLADSWFLEDKFYRRNYKLYEQNIYLNSYNSVLTVLWEK